MSTTFNADEVFEMAEEIERNGAKFYREAAQKATSQDTKTMFLNLAGMEDSHLQTFQTMRKELKATEKEPTSFDPFDEASLYLQTLADGKGSEGLRAPMVKLTGRESMQEILEIAIGAEKNSVLFYVGLKGMVPAGTNRDRIEAIIREEVRHAADLQRRLADVKAS